MTHSRRKALTDSRATVAGRPYRCGQGGLCMQGESVGSNSGVEPTTAYSTWGGSVVANDDFTEYHMCAHRFSPWS